MERVVNFLNAHQHKILFLFKDSISNRVRFMLVLSRRRPNLFLMEIGHGGIEMPSRQDEDALQKGDYPLWSVLNAEVYQYTIRPVNTTETPMEMKAHIDVLTFMGARIPSWGWDLPQPPAIAMFHHPFLFISRGETIPAYLPYRMDDFEWSLEYDGCFLLIPLEDFYQIKHTIHERIEKITRNKMAFIGSTVSDFLKTIGDDGDWVVPVEDKFCAVLDRDLKEIVRTQKHLDKTATQLIDLYKILHDVSLESLNIEDRLSSIDQMVFHQILSFGQQKRNLHRSIDQLRLLEKHTLEFIITLYFQHDHGYIRLLKTVLALRQKMMECENMIREYIRPVRHASALP